MLRGREWEEHLSLSLQLSLFCYYEPSHWAKHLSHISPLDALNNIVHRCYCYFTDKDLFLKLTQFVNGGGGIFNSRSLICHPLFTEKSLGYSWFLCAHLPLKSQLWPAGRAGICAPGQPGPSQDRSTALLLAEVGDAQLPCSVLLGHRGSKACCLAPPPPWK